MHFRRFGNLKTFQRWTFGKLLYRTISYGLNIRVAFVICSFAENERGHHLHFWTVFSIALIFSLILDCFQIIRLIDAQFFKKKPKNNWFWQERSSLVTLTSQLRKAAEKTTFEVTTMMLVRFLIYWSKISGGKFIYGQPCKMKSGKFFCLLSLSDAERILSIRSFRS